MATLAASKKPAPRRRLGTVLGIALPVSVALVSLVLLGRRRRKARRQQHRVAAAQERQARGPVVDLQLPSAPPRAPRLPLLPPKPLKVVMADVRLPVPLTELWAAVFANPADLLPAFHATRGDFEFSMSPWRQAEGGPSSRTLEYISPLKNPLGPKQARNVEVLEVAQLAPSGFVLRTKCTTEGVPFSSNFANYLLWVATEDVSGGSRLVITGECKFHNPVWGPLRGKIESESIKGMGKAYEQFSAMLVDRLGGSSGPGSSSSTKAAGGAAPAAAAQPGVPPSSYSSSLLSTPRTLAALLANGSGQQSTATLFLALAAVVVVFRLSLGDFMATQLLRRILGQYLSVNGGGAAPA